MQDAEWYEGIMARIAELEEANGILGKAIDRHVQTIDTLNETVEKYKGMVETVQAAEKLSAEGLIHAREKIRKLEAQNKRLRETTYEDLIDDAVEKWQKAEAEAATAAENCNAYAQRCDKLEADKADLRKVINLHLQTMANLETERDRYKAQVERLVGAIEKWRIEKNHFHLSGVVAAVKRENSDEDN